MEGQALTRRRTAVNELGDALRTLVENATVTEATTDDLLHAATEIRDVIARLGARVREPGTPSSADDLFGGVRMYNPVTGVREPGTPSSADDLFGGVRMYNPVTGAGSALAPPVRIEVADGEAIGRCTLGMAFEGPPMFAHGGVSAMLLDQILGHAVVASGNPGMTVRLDTSYRAPVPLLTPLRLTAVVREVDGRRVTATGAIATEAEPDTALVTATGTFVGLRADQTRRLFGAVLRPHP